jgi:hypothetical protein
MNQQTLDFFTTEQQRIVNDGLEVIILVSK